MTTQNILALALPVLLGFLVWFFQQLVQRSWNLYEEKRRVYLDYISLVDSLFEGGDASRRKEYMIVVRGVWLIGSDEVIKAIGALHTKIKTSQGHKHSDELYSEAIAAIRRDLYRRTYLPPGKTSLGTEDFPLEKSGTQ